jgi:hypothetical protein
MSDSNAVVNNGNKSLNENIIDAALLEVLVRRHKYDWKRIGRSYNALTDAHIATAGLREEFQIVKPSPTLKHNLRFSNEEDFIIVRGVVKYGLRSDCIAEEISGRSEISIRNRYYSFIAKKKKPNRGCSSHLKNQNQQCSSNCLDLMKGQKEHKYAIPLNSILSTKIQDLELEEPKPTFLLFIEILLLSMY